MGGDEFDACQSRVHRPRCAHAFGFRGRSSLQQEREQARRETNRRRHCRHDRAQGYACYRDLRRSDPKLTSGQHPGTRLRFFGEARLRRRLGGQGWAGSVPDGSEAVPGASRCSSRSAAASAGGHGSGQGQLGSHQAARRAERAFAEGSRRCNRAIPADKRRRRTSEGATRGGQPQPLVYHDQVPGQRR